MAAPTRYDVVVVGAGSGGLTAAKTAARFGAKTMLVERLPRLGGAVRHGSKTSADLPGRMHPCMMARLRLGAR